MEKIASNKSLIAWCETWDVPFVRACLLRALVVSCAKQLTKFHNGDAYPGCNLADKAECSQRWLDEAETTQRAIILLATDMGFTDVNYEGGLYPTFAKDGKDGIMLP